ncbi:MAG: response regulator transcription factor [Solirubrobacteraceae bacterium]|nr:response regulator transcription factor [Solirubrobacteraceae bacterium]
MSLSVLIVDDHDGFRSRAKRALELDGFEVVAEAGDIASGLQACAESQPDLVLLDVHLPDGSGLDVAEQFVAGPGDTCVVLISTYDEVDMAHAGDQPGVAGFLPKGDLSGAALNELLAAYACQLLRRPQG